MRFETKTDEEGAFTFEIPPGNWRFGFESDKGWIKVNDRFCESTAAGMICDVGNLAGG